ncbi:MAG TPA: ParB/RepB/Spo0J family partition protein [Polyangia bacterium]|nr:ParB/RepB/Spo0J family partition protein [Polyangia bacterium]
MSKVGKLAHLPVDRIQRNPDNPRIFFRASELEGLQQSIQKYGVQVPISVFKRGQDYFLIDGERRWRCASKLNLETIPALIQEDPGQLDNLLLMYNIHALREQWDTMTVALKLPTITKLLEERLGRRPTEADLAEATGQSRGMIRKCRLLTALPEKHKNVLLGELKKPKSKQELGEEFYLEMEKSLKVISRLLPNAIKNVDQARDKLVAKRRAKGIATNIDFRMLSKMARIAAAGEDRQAVTGAIRRVVDEPNYSIERAWDETVSAEVAERDLVARADGLLARLQELTPDQLDDDLREHLEALEERLHALLHGEGG